MTFWNPYYSFLLKGKFTFSLWYFIYHLVC